MFDSAGGIEGAIAKKHGQTGPSALASCVMRVHVVSPAFDGPWLVALAAIAGALAATSPGPIGLVVVVAIVSTRLRGARRPTRRAVVVASIAFVVACARAMSSAHDVAARHAWATAALPHPDRCVVTGEIVSMPRMLGVLSADVAPRAIECGGASIAAPRDLRVRVHALPEAAVRGAIVEVVTDVGVARWTTDPDLPAPAIRRGSAAAALSGTAIVARVTDDRYTLAGRVDAVRVALRRALVDAVAPTDAPLTRALVLGEDDLASDDAASFRGSGLAHLLAVSGAHVALVVGGLVAILRALLRRWAWLATRVDVSRPASLVGAIAAPIYAQLSGDAASARRAAWMATAMLLARAADRRADVWRALAASVIAMVAMDPLTPFDASFAMSLGATIGLLTVGPWLLARLAPRTLFAEPSPSFAVRARRRLASAATASLAATIGCAPMVLAMGAGLPTLGVLANLVAVPLGEVVALPLSNALAALGAIGVRGGVAKAIAAALAIDLRALRAVAAFAASPPALSSIAQLRLPPPTSWQLVVAASAIVVATTVPRVRARPAPLVVAAIAAWLAFEGRAVAAGRPRGLLRVTAIDVGQGDATLVDLPDGGAMLVDAGGEVGSSFDPGAAIVSPILAARRRSRLDVVVLSHPHPDHFGGLAAALGLARAPRDVGAFWDTGQGEEERVGGAYGALLLAMRARAVPIVRPDALCDRPRSIGGARVEVLHPCPRFDPAHGANDNSFVLRVSYGRRAALLVGDAEHAAEASLLSKAASRLHADLLKVGHHGSRTSSGAAFVDAVGPSTAIVSCGVRNRFDHPHSTTLATFARAGVRLFRTDRDGSVRWTTDGDRVWVEPAAR
jgi:competence protein ComEC